MGLELTVTPPLMPLVQREWQDMPAARKNDIDSGSMSGDRNDTP